MKYPIFFSDMDGTLLDDSKNISDAVYHAIDDYTKAGGRLVLSSGRPIDSILETKEKLKLSYSNMYVIAYNGGMLYDCDAKRTLLEEHISLSDIQTVLNLAREMGIHCQTYSDTHILSESDNDYICAYRKNIHLPLLVKKEIPAYLTSINQTPFKLLAIDKDRQILDKFNMAVEKETNQRLYALYSAKYPDVIYSEIIPKQTSKGRAIAFLCDYLHIPAQNSVAAGDAGNDSSMLQAAGIGIAMKNAEASVKAIADYVTTKTNNEDGILEVFEKWLNITLS